MKENRTGWLWFVNTLVRKPTLVEEVVDLSGGVCACQILFLLSLVFSLLHVVCGVGLSLVTVSHCEIVEPQTCLFSRKRGASPETAATMSIEEPLFQAVPEALRNRLAPQCSLLQSKARMGKELRRRRRCPPPRRRHTRPATWV